MSSPETKEPAKGDYAVGYCRPPEHTRFQKGKSGNPKGRPKGHRNLKSELTEIAAKRVVIRDGDTERQLSLLAANFLAHAIKGAKGDARSSALIFNLAKMGLVDVEDDAENIDAVPIPTANKPHPSDSLFEGLNLELLSRDEQADLSRLAEVIDLGGDVTALRTGRDFEKLKHLVEKGRGKDITPQ